mmetsp:Transcript_2378/g.8014  ORF Transcript_2378/g.8014 Transcript_2378/m.8014 type:complete len:303 (+) Transcript_2378:128-1036(+)
MRASTPPEGTTAVSQVRARPLSEFAQEVLERPYGGMSGCSVEELVSRLKCPDETEDVLPLTPSEIQRDRWERMQAIARLDDLTMTRAVLVVCFNNGRDPIVLLADWTKGTIAAKLSLHAIAINIARQQFPHPKIYPRVARLLALQSGDTNVDAVDNNRRDRHCRFVERLLEGRQIPSTTANYNHVEVQVLLLLDDCVGELTDFDPDDLDLENTAYLTSHHCCDDCLSLNAALGCTTIGKGKDNLALGMALKNRGFCEGLEATDPSALADLRTLYQYNNLDVTGDMSYVTFGESLREALRLRR